MLRQIRILHFMVLAAVIFAAGILGGGCLGRVALSKTSAGEISAALVFFNPSSVYIDTVRLLNSSDAFKRLSGYYAYAETGLIDLDYLYRRYTEEESPIIKSAIIWAASGSRKTDDVISFYEKIYKLAGKRNQEFILNYIETNDIKFYNDFIETYQIKK